MAIYQEQQLREVSRQFQIYGQILHAEPCKIGHINETYTATYSQGGTLVRYVHQKINQSVFRDPEGVMENVMRVTDHLRDKLSERGIPDVTRRALTVIPTRDGKPFYRNGARDVWRTFFFIENTQTFESVQSTDQAYQAGFAFGQFQDHLNDLKGPRLHETIPYFHHTPRRFKALLDAVKADRVNRGGAAKAEIEFALERESMVGMLVSALEQGKLEERVTHNDTKFNNVMLDSDTGKATCVVDLDTVMPGSVLYDFGDMIRTTTSPTMEDERDLSKVRMQMPMFEALTRGYLDATPFLTAPEKSFLTFAGKIITFTIGLRFLTDFLSGDQYFRVHRPNHNLDRCRTQFGLVRSIEDQEDAMEVLVEKLWKSRGPGMAKPRRPSTKSKAGKSPRSTPRSPQSPRSPANKPRRPTAK